MGCHSNVSAVVTNLLLRILIRINKFSLSINSYHMNTKSENCNVLVTLINLLFVATIKSQSLSILNLIFDFSRWFDLKWIKSKKKESCEQKMSQIIPEAVIRQLPQKRKAEGFDVEYRLKYSGTTETDKRTMTFVDNLWGIEVTGAKNWFHNLNVRTYLIKWLGGADQFEQLTIIAVKRTGLARRAGNKNVFCPHIDYPFPRIYSTWNRYSCGRRYNENQWHTCWESHFARGSVGNSWVG